MISNIKERFVKFISENNLIEKGDGVIIGLSGGPDSVCLLHMLCKIRNEFNLKIVAVHINHMLRGVDANDDEEFAKKICSDLKVEFFSKRIDINKYAKENGLSSETAGREVRYNFFKEIMEKLKYNKIATAHNANDQAETIIMRMMRGTGLEGLGGIPVKREEIYIRPILFMKREEVEEYCKVEGLNARIDSTNLERVYSRNKVRLDILPYMREHFNSDVIESINRMALLLQNDNEFIQQEVDKQYKKYCIIGSDEIIIKEEIFNCNKAILNRIIRKAISQVSGNIYNVEMKHIEEVCELNRMGTNKKINLPNGILAKNVYNNIYIRKGEKIKKELKKQEIKISKEEILHKEILFEGYKITFEELINKKSMNFNESNLIKYFDFDKINGNIIIRHRKNGDKIIPLGMNGSKKLKDIFIDMKIPKEQREEFPIIQFDEQIGWIVGIKVSDKYKITKETKKILKVICERKGLEDEG